MVLPQGGRHLEVDDRESGDLNLRNGVIVSDCLMLARSAYCLINIGVRSNVLNMVD